MVFTSAEEAKPKAPREDGLPCLGCGATEASQWRGPGGRYCSCCKKKAAAARHELTADARDRRIAELEEALLGAKETITALSKSSMQQAALLAQQGTRLQEHEETVAAMSRQLARLAQQLAMPRAKHSGAKRAPLRPLPAQPPPALRSVLEDIDE